MSAVQVEQAIGRPARNPQFGNESGPTWTYSVDGEEMTVFDVTFVADGRVVSDRERTDRSGRGRGGGR